MSPPFLLPAFEQALATFPADMTNALAIEAWLQAVQRLVQPASFSLSSYTLQ